MVTQIQSPEKSLLWSLPTTLNDFLKRSQAFAYSSQQLALSFSQVGFNFSLL